MVSGPSHAFVAPAPRTMTTFSPFLNRGVGAGLKIRGRVLEGLRYMKPVRFLRLREPAPSTGIPVAPRQPACQGAVVSEAARALALASIDIGG